jgi:hypothetical protein
MFSVKSGMPDASTRKTSKYPLPDLEIGQYFFVPNGNIRQLSANVSYAMKHRRGCTQKQFVCRTIEEGGVRGVAVYRIPHPIFDSAEFIEHEYQSRLKSWEERKERHAKGKFYENEPTPDHPDYEHYMREPKKRIVPQ